MLDLWAASIDDAVTFLNQFKERFDALGKRGSPAKNLH
jgi:hypothetical protein